MVGRENVTHGFCSENVHFGQVWYAEFNYDIFIDWMSIPNILQKNTSTWTRKHKFKWYDTREVTYDQANETEGF